MSTIDLKFDLNDIEALFDAVEIRLAEESRRRSKLIDAGEFGAAQEMCGHIKALTRLHTRLMNAAEVLDAD